MIVTGALDSYTAYRQSPAAASSIVKQPASQRLNDEGEKLSGLETRIQTGAGSGDRTRITSLEG